MAVASCRAGSTPLTVNGAAACEERITTVGPNTWTPPSDVTSVDVTVVGGGGSGAGGAFVTGSPYMGGNGGGGGQVAVRTGVSVSSSTPVTVTVGDGGTASAAVASGTPLTSAAGVAGVGSSFDSVTAGGGGGGSAVTVELTNTFRAGSSGRIIDGATSSTTGGFNANFLYGSPLTGTAGQGGGGAGAGTGGIDGYYSGGQPGAGNGGYGYAPVAGLFSTNTSSFGGGGGGGNSGIGQWGSSGYDGGGSGGSTGSYSNGVAGSDGLGGGGGGAGGDVSPGVGGVPGDGGSGIVVIRYLVPVAPTLTAKTPASSGQVGSAYSSYTFVATGAPTPTYSVTSGSLPPGVTLNPTTGVLSGTPTSGGPFTFIVAATNSLGSDSANISITVSQSSGTSQPAASPEPTPTPTPTASPAPLELISNEALVPGSNPNIPVSGVPLGASVFLVNGAPVPVSVKPDAERNATGLEVTGDGFTMRLVGQSANNRPLGLTPDGALILEQDRTAFTEGTGFQPNSEVRLYLFSEPRFLGAVMTDASGSFRGTVLLPLDVQSGRHTLQSNGFAPDGAVRSLSLGVQVTNPAARPATRKAKATVYFTPYSAELDAVAKKSLRELARGRAKGTVRIAVIGYVQASSTTMNDRALSSQRAKAAAAYLKGIGVKGVVVARGDGISRQDGAAARRASVNLTYHR